MKRCPGPKCLTLIPRDRDLCHFCRRTLLRAEIDPRYQPPNLPPAGFEWRVYVDREWRVPSGFERCRQRRCPNPPVADLMRGNPAVPRWWAGCAEHLYGRWLERDAVVGWRLFRFGAPTGPYFVRAA